MISVNLQIKVSLIYLWSEVAQSCPTLCNPMDYSLPGSSVHGIFQARVLEWVAISFSRGSSRPRDRTQVSCTAGRHFTIWDTRKALQNIKNVIISAMFIDRKIQYCQTVSFSQCDHRFKVISIKIPTSHFVDIDKLILKFIRWNKKSRIDNTTLRRKKKMKD